MSNSSPAAMRRHGNLRNGCAICGRRATADARKKNERKMGRGQGRARACGRPAVCAFIVLRGVIVFECTSPSLEPEPVTCQANVAYFYLRAQYREPETKASTWLRDITSRLA